MRMLAPMTDLPTDRRSIDRVVIHQTCHRVDPTSTNAEGASCGICFIADSVKDIEHFESIDCLRYVKG